MNRNGIKTDDNNSTHQEPKTIFNAILNMTLSRSGMDLGDFTFRRNNNAGDLCVQCQSHAKINSKGEILNDHTFQGCQTSSCPGYLGKNEKNLSNSQN